MYIYIYKKGINSICIQKIFIATTSNCWNGGHIHNTSCCQDCLNASSKEEKYLGNLVFQNGPNNSISIPISSGTELKIEDLKSIKNKLENLLWSV